MISLQIHDIENSRWQMVASQERYTKNKEIKVIYWEKEVIATQVKIILYLKAINANI